MDDVVTYIVAAVFIILLILISIRMQISTIDGLSQVTVENNDRLGLKAAGAMHIYNQSERQGVLTEDQFEELQSTCASGVKGFNADLLILRSSDCTEAVIPLPVPLQVEGEDGVQNLNLIIGEQN